MSKTPTSPEDGQQRTPQALLWDLMRGYRGKYGWAIVALFVFTSINYLPPLIASAAIDHALSDEPKDGILTQKLTELMGGAEYIASLLAGYADTPECALESDIEGSYNKVFTAGGFPDECKYEDGTHKVEGSWIAMGQPLWGDDVVYEDGSPTDIEATAQNVAAFLMWTAEPKQNARKEAGFIAVVFLGILSVLLYLTNKRIWAPIKRKGITPAE